MVQNFKSGLKSLLEQGLWEPELYDDLIYKLSKLISRADFSDQFRKVRRIGYNINEMRRSACLLINQIRVYRGLTGGFLLLQNFCVAISVRPHVCFILVLILISMFLR